MTREGKARVFGAALSVVVLVLMGPATLAGAPEPNGRAATQPPPASSVSQSPVAFADTAIHLASMFYARPAAPVIPQLKERQVLGTGLAGDEAVVRGQYLARVGGCIGCHTKADGVPFAGGLGLQTPFGLIYSTNITPHTTAGIGRYSLIMFDQALRHGKSKSGENIYPAMPYPSYARMSESDIAAMYQYFMQAVKPAAQTNTPTALNWPFKVRSLISIWNLLYLPSPGFVSDPTETIQWNRGAYLVQGVGHCGACHTPRGLSGAEKATSIAGGNSYLAGALIDGWYAQPLRSRELETKATRIGPGLGQWSADDIAEYLRTGRNAFTAAFGSMSDVVAHSTQHLTTADASAIAIYLKSVSDPASRSQRMISASQNSGPALAPPPDPTTNALRAGDITKRGAAVYLNNCSACHRSDGEGSARTFPSLAWSSSVSAADATSLIRIVLQGSAMPATLEAPSALAMPGLGWRLTDEDVASVLSLIRTSWGNDTSAVSSAEVGRVRRAMMSNNALER